MFDYEQICQECLDNLTERAREIITRRFGLKTGQRETLEAMGRDLGITRERVRQIEKASLAQIRTRFSPELPIFRFFKNQLRLTGNLRREDKLLPILGPGFSRHIFLLLSAIADFTRFGETEDLYSFWSIDESSARKAPVWTNKICALLKKRAQLLSLEELEQNFPKIDSLILLAHLELSKKIEKAFDGSWGLVTWPEVTPQGVKDRAYLVFKREQRPLHFVEVAELINQSVFHHSFKEALPQTVHNELIRDPRFVLVGRGLYALGEWGYSVGTVKEVISRVLKETRKPLTQDELVEKVLERRFVAKNTVLLNLRDKEYFDRDGQGRYRLKAKLG